MVAMFNGDGQHPVGPQARRHGKKCQNHPRAAIDNVQRAGSRYLFRDPDQFGKVRKDIARVKTVMNELARQSGETS